MGGMRKSIRDISISTVKQKKHLPSRAWNAMVWKSWRASSRWDKKQLIEQGFERNPPFYAAAKIIAQTVASIPLFVEYDHEGKRRRTTDHPALKAMERDCSVEEFVERLTLYLIVTGETYIQKIFKSNRLLGMITLPSQYTTPVLGDQYNPVQYYEFSYQKEEKFSVNEIIAIINPSLSNYFSGLSAGVPLSEVIDLNNSAVTWNKNISQAGGLPPIIAKANSTTDSDTAQELQDSWRRQSGAQGSHLLKIVGADVEIQDLSTNPNDAEWDNALKTSMRWIFMCLGVSSSLMNDAANKTYNNVKESEKALYTHACIPIGKKIFRNISRGIKTHFADRPEIMMDVDGIEALQENRKDLSERVVKEVDSGLITRNEGRVQLGHPPINDDIANRLIISNTPTPVKKPEAPVSTNGTGNAINEP